VLPAAVPVTVFSPDPYPGAAPPWSFVQDGDLVHPLGPDRRVGGVALDAWLTARGVARRAGRVPVLVYGSNRCPGKIAWLRAELGLTGPVVVLRARTLGLAAVWAGGLRRRDGQRPAVLAAAPGVAQQHAVWLADTDQLRVLDRCEGRGGDGRYRLARLHSGTVTLDDGTRITDPWCYLGAVPARRPLLVDGLPVHCADVPQAAARRLTGEIAPGDGLRATTVQGDPHPDSWPDVLFTYGLLQPGQPSWHLLVPHAVGEPWRASVAGAVHDTGYGYPGLDPTGSGRAPGLLVRLRDPATALPTLDAYEGPSYERVRLRADDGTVCWAYAWRGGVHGLARLPAGWPPP
jgi:gamma-glutamylcyclotransferase (GGCT)/AIG2-like uncharacterized protein YtfP